MLSKKISKKVKELPISGIRAMLNICTGMKDVIDLVSGPRFTTPDYIVEAAKKALDQGYTNYTPNAGYTDLREAISEKLLKENKMEFDPVSEIMVTAGVTEAFLYAILTTMEKGDEVVISDPTFTCYDPQIRFAGGVPIRIPVKEEDDFRLLPEEIEKAISRRTRMILINTPANPTGAVLGRNDLEGIAEIAKRHDLLVLTDEIYEKFTYDGARHYSIASLPDMKDRTIPVNGPTKTYAMGGWRIGYVAANKEIIEHMVKIQQNDSVCPCAVSQRAALAALLGPEDYVRNMLSEYLRRRELMVSELNKVNGFRCKKPKGSFYAFPNISGTGMTSHNLAIFLIKAGVVTVPGSVFGQHGEDHLRISYALPTEPMEEAVKRIRCALEGFAQPRVG